MKMGKVIQKLQAHAAVAALTDGGDTYVIVLAQGYANNGAVELRAKTAHEARLFIDGASNGSAPKRAPKLRIVRENEDGSTEEVVAAETPRFKPSRMGPPCPIFLRPKGFNASEQEGREAALQGFAKDSHPYGASVAAKDFEGAWQAEMTAQRKAAEADAADAAAAARVAVELPLAA